MKIGDMVVLLACHPLSTGYAEGVRIGHIGTIKSIRTINDPNYNYDWLVTFPTIDCNCPEKDLRKIEPPEAGRWDWTVWAPGRKRTLITPLEEA